MSNIDFEEKYMQLKHLGAGDFAHIEGSLINHLQGTYALLKDWNAESYLCDAGLFHAAYSTAGYSQSFVEKMNRHLIRKIVGVEAEAIIYTYCACDREFFWPQIGVNKSPVFLNRFTQAKYSLLDEEIHSFCELTVANELEIALHSEDFINVHGKSLMDLFNRMSLYISENAKLSIRNILYKNL